MFRTTSQGSSVEKGEVLYRQLGSLDAEQVAVALLELSRSDVNLERATATCLKYLNDEDRCVQQCAVNSLTVLARRGAPLDLRSTIYTLQRISMHGDDLNGTIPDALVVLQGMHLSRERWVQPPQDDYM